MFARLFLYCAICFSVAAFAPARGALRPRQSQLSMVSVFDKAVKDWAAEYPAIYNVGWGPTTKAERWNGRHAMFGWVALLVTGYCKGHGLIPNPETALDLKEWGTLAYLYGGSISNERAIIIVGKCISLHLRTIAFRCKPQKLLAISTSGHLHLLLFSVCAAVAPLSFQDKLYLEKGEEHEAASGLFPKYKHGLTLEAEILNGRLAMLGLTVLLASSITTQQPILDTINKGLGGFLF